MKKSFKKFLLFSFVFLSFCLTLVPSCKKKNSHEVSEEEFNTAMRKKYDSLTADFNILCEGKEDQFGDISLAFDGNLKRADDKLYTEFKLNTSQVIEDAAENYIGIKIPGDYKAKIRNLQGVPNFMDADALLEYFKNLDIEVKTPWLDDFVNIKEQLSYIIDEIKPYFSQYKDFYKDYMNNFNYNDFRFENNEYIKDLDLNLEDIAMKGKIKLLFENKEFSGIDIVIDYFHNSEPDKCLLTLKYSVKYRDYNKTKITEF